MEIRLQLPEGGGYSVSLPEDATLADLKSAITTQHSIPEAEQTLLAGFPPAALSDDSATLSALLAYPPAGRTQKPATPLSRKKVCIGELLATMALSSKVDVHELPEQDAGGGGGEQTGHSRQ